MGVIKFFGSGAHRLNNPFVTLWKTDNPGVSGSNQIKLPLSVAGTYDFLVEWGDGTRDRIHTWSDPKRIHTYSSPGIYEVKIRGKFLGLAFNAAESGTEGNKLLEISRWGCYQHLPNPAFYSCPNMDVTATDVPDLSLTNSLAGMFRGCLNLKGNASFALWDTAHIQLFGSGNNGFIRDCKLFNAPISEWNTSSATSYNEFAFGANALDQNFGNYNMENTTLVANILRGTKLSVENYSNTLIGWAAQNLKPNLTLRLDPLRYNAAGQAARQYIIDNFNWTFIGDGLAA